MKEVVITLKHSFSWIDFGMTCLAAVGIGYVIRENVRGLSFGGFGALFFILLLSPGFAALVAEAILLLQARRRVTCAVVAYALQIVTGIPSTMLLVQDPRLFGLLWVYTVLMVFGAAGLILLYLQSMREE